LVELVKEEMMIVCVALDRDLDLVVVLCLRFEMNQLEWIACDSRSYFTHAAAITCAPEMPTIDRGFAVISELRQISNHCPPGLASRARLTGSPFLATYLVACPKGRLTFKGPKGR
jgi:hypothetical protein